MSFMILVPYLSLLHPESFTSEEIPWPSYDHTRDRRWRDQEVAMHAEWTDDANK